jgi:hypothetical protein
LGCLAQKSFITFLLSFSLLPFAVFKVSLSVGGFDDVVGACDGEDSVFTAVSFAVVPSTLVARAVAAEAGGRSDIDWVKYVYRRICTERTAKSLLK